MIFFTFYNVRVVHLSLHQIEGRFDKRPVALNHRGDTQHIIFNIVRISSSGATHLR